MEKTKQDEKLEFWRLVVEEFENSEKSIKEQCEENDIALGQYYNWRKKVRESDREESASFVELNSLKIEDSKVAEVGIYLEYNKDFTIRLSEDFNPSVLKSIIRVLKSL